jgi:uncharacterized protein
MPASLPDPVDCARLAREGVTVERDFALSDMTQLRDLLAEPDGSLQARFAFGLTASGRPGANVTVSAAPKLICQRCMQKFALPVRSGSDVEFSADETVADADRELFPSDAEGRVSLRDLAEEELLLALPVAPACATPDTCGHVPTTDDSIAANDAPLRRPFEGLKDLLKKT